MNEDAIIEFNNVGLTFGRHEVHKSLNFKISAGESITILGPSGTGKTLILKMILGLIKPTRGDVRVFGKSLGELTESQLGEIRSRIGMLFQGAALFDSMNVYENIAYSLREKKALSEAEIAEVVREKLEIIGLPGIQEKIPSQLSGGQKKRVALARALASAPAVVLFDEPTTGLDPTSTKMIDDLIIKLNQEFNITCIAVTHDIASAMRFSKRWVFISEGQIQADGPIAELMQSSVEVNQFVSGSWKGA
jgi:phospholipid/cholesterol/gamma-HCH transport system ATP-binding protein